LFFTPWSNITYKGILVGVSLNSSNPYIIFSNINFTKNESLNLTLSPGNVTFLNKSFPVENLNITYTNQSFGSKNLTNSFKSFGLQTIAYPKTTNFPVTVQI